MTTDQSNIAEWIANGQSRGAAWLIIVYDAQTQRQLPVYVMPGDNLEQIRQAYNSDWRTEVTAPIDI